MGYISPTYYDRVRYTLQHISYGTRVITEPEGYNEDEKEYARHKKYHGIFPKFSNNLRFVGDGADYINTVRKLYGINSKIRLVKEYKDQDGIWQRSYTGFLDMSSWQKEGLKVSVKFNSGGLESILKSRINDKFEIERTETIKGNSINPFVPKYLELHGRRVFLNTEFNILSSANQAKLSVESNAGNTRNQTVGLPLNLFSQSHDLAHSVIPESQSNENQGTTGMMFYANNDRVRDFNINLNFDFNVFFQQYENIQWCFYTVNLTKYSNGVNYDVASRIELFRLDSGFSNSDPRNLPEDYDDAYPQFNKNININWDGEIRLLENQSLGIELYLKADMYGSNSSPRNNAGVRAFAQNITGALTIEEDSSYPSSITPAIFYYDLFDRLTNIITGKTGLFKSDFFARKDLPDYYENGEGAYYMASHGHWIRGFTKDNELYKPFSISMKDALAGAQVPYNIGLGIEKIGFKERIIVEDKKYFYNPNITIRIGDLDENGVFKYKQVHNVKRKEYLEEYYSSIYIGSERGGDYEEIMGLEETNTNSNFVTPIEGVVNEYKASCKVRFDPYGEEIIRRRSISTHPTTDQNSDTHIWGHDAKPGVEGVYLLKRDTDVLSTTPIGMFSPETSYNFIFSPVNMLKKHGWVINAGLRLNQKGKLIFGSSRGKSSVTMQTIGDNAYAENGNFPIKDLEKSRFIPEEIEFESEVNEDMQRQLEGYTTILGKKIPNFYGTIEFMNEDREIEKAFILSVKPNNKGEWRVLKSAL